MYVQQYKLEKMKYTLYMHGCDLVKVRVTGVWLFADDEIEVGIPSWQKDATSFLDQPIRIEIM